MLSLSLLYHYPCCHVSGKTLDNTHQVYRFADKIMATESEIVPDRSLESRGPGLRYFRDREVFLSDDSSWDEEEDDNSEADEIKDGDGDAVDIVVEEKEQDVGSSPTVPAEKAARDDPARVPEKKPDAALTSPRLSQLGRDALAYKIFLRIFTSKEWSIV